MQEKIKGNIYFQKSNMQSFTCFSFLNVDAHDTFFLLQSKKFQVKQLFWNCQRATLMSLTSACVILHSLLITWMLRQLCPLGQMKDRSLLPSTQLVWGRASQREGRRSLSKKSLQSLQIFKGELSKVLKIKMQASIIKEK